MTWHFVLIPCNSNSGHNTINVMKHSKQLQWRHNERDGVSNPQPHDFFTQSFIQVRMKDEKTSKLRVIGFCEVNSPVTGEFPTQRTSNVEKVSIWWRHHATIARARYGVPCHNLPELDHNPDDLWHIIVQFWHVMAYREKAYYASPPKRAAQSRRRWDISVENTQVMM